VPDDRHPRRLDAGGPAAKGGAAHYTPAAVARHLVTASVGRWLWRGPVPDRRTLAAPRALAGHGWREPAEVMGLRILDPACGDGAFLAAARDVILEYLTARARAVGDALPSIETRRRLAREVLHGVDLDPDAIAAARRRLDPPDTRRGGAGSPEPLRLRCGNMLLTPGMLDGVGASAAERQRLRPWDPAGPDGFGEVLAGGGFDFVLGNPPFGASARLAPLERRLLRGAYALAAGGQPDLFQLFYERTVGALLRPGGTHVFLVPDALLARDELAATRRAVVRALSITRLVAVGAVFPGAPGAGARRVAVSVVGVVGVKRPARCPPAVVVERWRGGRPARHAALPRAWLCPDSGEPWAMAAPRDWFGPRGYRARVEAGGLRLGDLLLPGSAGLTRGEELGKSRLPRLDPGARRIAGHLPILAGEDIRRGTVGTPRHQAPVSALRKRKTVEPVPRLLVVKTGGGIVAAASEQPYPVLQSVYVLHLTAAARAQVDEATLAAVLSSAVLTTYAWFRWTSGKALHPQLTLGNVRELPLPPLATLAAARPRLAARLTPRGPARGRPPRAPMLDAGAGAAVERALDERVAELYGMDLCTWEHLIAPALAALPPAQRSRWFGAPSARDGEEPAATTAPGGYRPASTRRRRAR